MFAGFGTTPATTRVVSRALGAPVRATTLVRHPARGLRVKINPRGFSYDAGPGGTLSLASVDVAGNALASYANGTLRSTAFGSDAITVNGQKAEEFLTVDRKLGTHTWRWHIDTKLEARVSGRGWVGFFDRRTSRLMSVAMLPAKIFDSNGHDVTPAGLRWRIDVVKKQQYLTLTLNDAKLPSPYTIDPGAYRTNNTASSTNASGTFTVTIPATVNADDLLLVHEAGQSTTATATFPSTPTDNSGGNTWATVSGTNVANATVDQFVWWKWAVSADASKTVTVTIPSSTSPTVTTAVVDVYKGLDSTKGGPQTTGATNTLANKKFNTPAITPSGGTTQEHMIMMVAGDSASGPAWPATVAAGGGTWAVQPSGANNGSSGASMAVATYDSDTSANTAYAATQTGNIFGSITNSVTSAFGFSDDVTAPSNSITITNGGGTSYMTAASGATGTVYYNGTNAGSFQLQNAVSDGQSGPASSTFPALGGTTTGWSHTAPGTITSPTGGPYNSGGSPNNFSWSAGTSSSPTEAIAGADNGGNTATTTLTFTNDTAATAPTITFPA